MTEALGPPYSVGQQAWVNCGWRITNSRKDQLIGEMQYGDTYRLAYIRGPEGIIVALAEQLG